jgi:polar amino acid transport system substrate-binding protein
MMKGFCGRGVTVVAKVTLAFAAAALLLAAVAAAAPTAPPKKKKPTTAQLRAKLPADIRRSNTLRIATSIYAPVDYYKADGKTLTGFDADIMRAVAKKLRVKIKWAVIDFSAIIPGITSGQYDFATDLNDTKKREEVVDFITEFRDGSSILVRKGNPDRLRNLSDLCGKTVVMTQGSVQIPIANTQSAKCEQSGKSKIDQLLVPDDPPARLALKSGRASAYLVNTLAGSYAAKTENGGRDFQILAGVYQPQYAGIIFPKKSKQLREAIRASLNAVIQDGTYRKIMARYGVLNNAIKKSVVNAATS